MKKCSGCKVELEEWRRANYCRDCAREYARRRRERDPEKFREADRRRHIAETPAQRDDRLRRSRAEYAAKRAANLSKRTCDVCRRDIPPERHARCLTCSEECRRARSARECKKWYLANRGPAVRNTPESAKRMSDAHIAAWAAGPNFKDRDCRGCGHAFSPNSAAQRYCSRKCFALWQIARRYNMTGDEMAAMLAAQDGKCALCGDVPTPTKRGLALRVDHCHATGKVRGLLCPRCNTGLGKFGDDPEKLERGAAYLRGALNPT